MELRLLGPVEMSVGERVWGIGPPQQRHTMAALAVDVGRPVTLETLIDRVWDEPPPGARRALQAHIARIRRLLEQAGKLDAKQARLERRSGGYVLDVAPDMVDLWLFRTLVDRARAAADSPVRAVDALTEALALWRGEPLAGLSGHWAAQSRQSWRHHHLDATLLWAQAMLTLGRPDEVLSPLMALADAYPLVEPLAVMMMRSLSATGRPAEALEHFTRMRARLVEELGTDPSPELQAVHQAILRGELDRSPRPARAAVRAVVPAQLPADVPGFAGRAEHLARLDALRVGSRASGSTAMAVAAITGTAGVGKTALAVHWAHSAAAEFPDGQLYVNLRGYTPSGLPMAPAEAVHGFLEALGVPPERLPAGLDAQAALYRSLLAGKRVLVVLDNARDADQVLLLLPGTATALVVTTSRDLLTPLVIAGAEPLAVAVLSDAEAQELLVRRLGGPRVAAEPDAARLIVAACARLPLALAVAAARVQHSRFSLATVATSLTSVGDPMSPIRVVFSSSVAALSEPASRLFRLLGLHPGPAVTADAAASLAGLPLPEARLLLSTLARANLLDEMSPGRFTFHDLLRAYAIELVEATDSGATRRATTVRMLDHYTHTAYRCALFLLPHRDPIELPLGEPAPGTRPARPGGYEPAMAWFDAEHQVLLGILRHAATAGFARQAWQLAWALDTFLGRRGHPHDRIAAWQTALTATETLHEPIAQAYAHRRLGYVQTRPGGYAKAITHLHAALHLYRLAGDKVGQAYVQCDLARVKMRQDSPREALGHGREGLTLFRSAGHRSGQAEALNAIGWYHAHLGELPDAIAAGEEALALLQQVGLRSGEAHAWDSLGYAHQRLGHHRRAVACFQGAIDVYRELGDFHHAADTLVRLAGTHRADGDIASARTALIAALDIYLDVDSQQAAGVRAELAGLDLGTRTPGAGDPTPFVNGSPSLP